MSTGRLQQGELSNVLLVVLLGVALWVAVAAGAVMLCAFSGRADRRAGLARPMAPDLRTTPLGAAVARRASVARRRRRG